MFRTGCCSAPLPLAQSSSSLHGGRRNDAQPSSPSSLSPALLLTTRLPSSPLRTSSKEGVGLVFVPDVRTASPATSHATVVGCPLSLSHEQKARVWVSGGERTKEKNEQRRGAEKGSGIWEQKAPPFIFIYLLNIVNISVILFQTQNKWCH